MPQYWERLFVVAARACAWLVAAGPLAVFLVLVAAAIRSGHANLDVTLVRTLFSQLIMTIAVGLIASLLGAALGIASALFSHELSHGAAGRVVRRHAKFIAALPAVAIGWFGVSILQPQHVLQMGWVALTAALMVATVVFPDAYILAVRAVRAVPAELLDAAAALGASEAQTMTHVVLPGSRSRLLGTFWAVFSHALPEGVAASIIFIYAARAGFALSHFSLPAVLLAQATALRTFDVSMPLTAMLLLMVSIAARFIAAKRIGALEWL